MSEIAALSRAARSCPASRAGLGQIGLGDRQRPGREATARRHGLSARIPESMPGSASEPHRIAARAGRPCRSSGRAASRRRRGSGRAWDGSRRRRSRTPGTRIEPRVSVPSPGRRGRLRRRRRSARRASGVTIRRSRVAGHAEVDVVAAQAEGELRALALAGERHARRPGGRRRPRACSGAGACAAAQSGYRAGHGAGDVDHVLDDDTQARPAGPRPVRGRWGLGLPIRHQRPRGSAVIRYFSSWWRVLNEGLWPGPPLRRSLPGPPIS